MQEEVTIQLPLEIKNFIDNLAFAEKSSPEEIIIKILNEYYYHLSEDQNSDEIPEELSMLKSKEDHLTISDTFKKEFNERD